MKLAHVAAIAAAGLAVAAFAGAFQPSGARGQAADTTPGVITAAGTGSVTLTPDRATFSFGTVSQARSASAALAATSQSVGRVIDALRKAGVSRNDIQTSEVSLSPRSNDSGEAIVGYTASNTVTVTVRRLANAGEIVDAAVTAGANQMYGPSLLAADQDAAYRNALNAAVAEARAKAETLASSAGLTLGRVTSLAESGAAPPRPFASEDAMRTAAVPIEPGTQKIEAAVSVTFALG